MRASHQMLLLAAVLTALCALAAGDAITRPAQDCMNPPITDPTVAAFNFFPTQYQIKSITPVSTDKLSSTVSAHDRV